MKEFLYSILRVAGKTIIVLLTIWLFITIPIGWYMVNTQRKSAQEQQENHPNKIASEERNFLVSASVPSNPSSVDKPVSETVSEETSFPETATEPSPSFVSREPLTEKDFVFNAKALPIKYKDFVIHEVNRLQNEDPLCNQHMEPSMTSLAGSRTTKKNPVFYVPCGEGGDTKNRYFSRYEEKGKMIPIESDGDAIACVDKVEERYFSILSPLTNQVRYIPKALKSYNRDNTVNIAIMYKAKNEDERKSLYCVLQDGIVKIYIFSHENGKEEYSWINGKTIFPHAGY